MTETTDQAGKWIQLTRAQRYYADVMMDVLVYTVVLNLFVDLGGSARRSSCDSEIRVVSPSSRPRLAGQADRTVST
jgi:hypothetical protein